MRILFLIIFIPSITFCQLNASPGTKSVTLAQVRERGEVAAYLTRSLLSSGDTLYMFSYLNGEYASIKDWSSFSLLGEANVREFYSLVSAMYSNNKKDEELNFNAVGKKKINLSWIRGDVFAICTDQYGLTSTFKLSKKVLEKFDVPF